MLGLLGVIGALFAGFMADGGDDDSDSAGRIGIVVIIGFGPEGIEFAMKRQCPSNTNSPPAWWKCHAE